MTYPLRVSFHASGRAKSHSFMYFKICAGSLVRYRALNDELHQLENLDPMYEAVFERVEHAALEPVVFAGMCLEAALYDLSACLFGDAFAEHTDKLDPVGKFVVLAQLVDRATPSSGSITLQSIQALVSARNKLVHHKSQPALELDFTKIIARAKKEHKQQVDGISASFRALVLLSLHFDGNIFEELRILPSFKKVEYWREIVPAELHEDVKWCIQATRRQKQRVEPSNTAT